MPASAPIYRAWKPVGVRRDHDKYGETHLRGKKERKKSREVRMNLKTNFSSDSFKVVEIDWGLVSSHHFAPTYFLRFSCTADLTRTMLRICRALSLRRLALTETITQDLGNKRLNSRES